MAYFAKGKVTAPKPVSYLAGLNKAIGDRVKLEAAAKAAQRKQELDLAKLMQDQREAQVREQLRLEKETNRRAEGYRREIRSINKNANIDQWLMPYWDEFVDKQVAATNGLTDEPERVEMMLDNLIDMAKIMSVNSSKEDELNALNVIATDYGQRQRANNQLKDSFMRIDDEEALLASQEASNLYNGGAFRGEGENGRLIWQNVDDVTALPSLVGFTYDHKTKQWSNEVTNIFESPYFHDQGNTGIMQTPYQMTFGMSFREHGNVERDELQDIEGWGLWEEQKAREHVSDILRSPSSVKGRSWRTQAVGYGPTAPFYKFESDPTRRDEIVRTIIEYDLYDSDGNMKPTYADNRGTIDAALKYAEDQITTNTYFDNRRPSSSNSGGGSNSGTSTANYYAATKASRKPFRKNGVLGSIYAPRWFRSNELYVTRPNPAIAEYERKEAEKVAEVQARPESAGVSPETIKIRALFELEQAGVTRPTQEEERIKIQQIITMPDSPDIIWVRDEDDNEIMIHRERDASKWAAIDGQLQATANARSTGVTLDMLAGDDMGMRWQYDNADARNAGGGSSSSGGFPSYPQWKATQPSGADDSPAAWRKAKADAGY